MNQDYVKIVTAAGAMEAEILRGLLQSAELDVVLRQESAGKAIGLGAGPLGAVDLLVPAAQEARAQELLDEYYSGSSDHDESDEVQG